MTNLFGVLGKNHLPVTRIKSAAYASVILSSVVLGACGGGGNAPLAQSANSERLFDLPADTVSRIGMIIFNVMDGRQFAAFGIPAGYMAGYAEFVEYQQVISEAYLASTYATPALDTCDFSIDSSDDSQDIGLDEDPQVAELDLHSKPIKAGDVISLTTPNGSWPDLVLNEDQFPAYEFETDISSLGELPLGSTVSIPGDEFPSFDNIAIPSVARFTDVSIAHTEDNFLTADTTLSWSAPTPANKSKITAVSVGTTYYDQSAQSEMLINITCNVNDDDEFNFPDNAKTLLSQYDFSIDGLMLIRYNVGQNIRGNSAVLALSSAIYFY